MVNPRFVVMDTEEDAKDTALDLKLKKRTFRGQSVKARIKTEAVVRSFYPVQPIPSIPAVFPVMPFAPIGVAGPIDMVPFGFVGVAPVTEVVVDNSVQSDIAEQNGGKNSDDADNGQGKGQSGARSSAPRADPRRTTRSGPARDTTADTRRRPEGPRRTTDTGRVGGKEREKKGTDGVAPKAPIEIDSISFPPLQATDDTPVPTPGYKDTYVKYTMDDIIAIVKNVKEAALPAELDANHHSLAITATPNLDLLKRQRTFSIDETREQLRQGRPVLKDAIIPGAVDYKSMMYGDDTHTKGAAAATAAATKKVDAVAPEVKKPEVEAEVKMDLGLTSPARLNSATWAAMVKSSAPAPLVEAGPVPSVPAPKVAPKPISAEKKAAAAPVTAPAAKSSTAPAKSGNNSRKEKGEQKDKKPNNKKKEKEGEDSKKSEHDVSLEPPLYCN